MKTKTENEYKEEIKRLKKVNNNLRKEIKTLKRINYAKTDNNTMH